MSIGGSEYHGGSPENTQDSTKNGTDRYLSS